MKVLLLAGGISTEREISQRSADNVEAALKKLGHKIVRADPAAQGYDLATLAAQADVVFPILHGEGGEDGVLQAELEQLGIPFLGSRATASHLAYDKVEFKQLLDREGVLTPKWETVTASSFSHAALARRPFVLKPIDGGSSIDTCIVRSPGSLPDGLQETLARYDEMLLEELIEGAEVTVGVLGETALPVILIIPPVGSEFDYDNKYNGQSQEIVQPKQLPQELQQRIQALAMQVHNAVGCRHLSRTDIMINSHGELYVLEINTIPGLTAESLVPKEAAAIGLDMVGLTRRLVELATEPR